MGLGDTTKGFFEEYRQRFSSSARLFAGKSEGRVMSAIYQPYKWLFIFPLLLISTFICGTLAMVVAILANPRRGSFFGVLWARVNSFFTPMTVTVVGAENMAPGSSYVITANHQSLYDIYVLYGWLGVDFKWVMKKELEKVPFLGPACKALGHIFIDRSDTKAAVETINAAKARIAGGTSVVFFPEGSRSSDGALKPFKKGAFKLAIDLGLPVLPVSICGTRKILPKGGIHLKPGGVTMIIHPPIPIAGYSEANITELMDKTRRIIDASLD